MTRSERAYILRIAKGEQFGEGDEYVPVTTFTIEQYQCGLRAGDQVRLKHDFPIENADRYVIQTIPQNSI